jgi:hypothetical protein
VGHVRLGNLPASRKWQAVVDLLSLGEASVSAIAVASAEAAEASLDGASNDRSVGHAFWLLSQLPIAASEDDFAAGLARLGINVGPEGPTLFALGSALTLALETNAWGDNQRTDLGAMARQSVVETVLSSLGESVPGLFEPTTSEIQHALAAFGHSDRFSFFARDFFSRLTRRSLEYFLSRELSNHVGIGRHFGSIEDHSSFSAALDLHCRQASRIIHDFAGNWYGKRLRDQTPVSRSDAAAFAHIAFRKVRAELKQRRSNNA